MYGLKPVPFICGFSSELAITRLKPSIDIVKPSRGFENPLPRTKVRGWHNSEFPLPVKPISIRPLRPDLKSCPDTKHELFHNL
jgi:hypothetical protein